MTVGAARPPHGLTDRLLDSRDLPAVIALHQRVVGATAADLVASETDAFFADHLERLGRVLGLCDGDRLAAYAVLGLPGPGDHNFAAYLDPPPADPSTVAHLDGISVAPEWRGRGLHRYLTRRRMEMAAQAGRMLVITTVAPGNLASLTNTLAEGLEIRRLTRLYGGWRFVLARRLPPTPSREEAATRWLPVSDLTAQAALLDAGWRGVRLRDEGDGRAAILYRAPSAP